MVPKNIFQLNATNSCPPAIDLVKLPFQYEGLILPATAADQAFNIEIESQKFNYLVEGLEKWIRANELDGLLSPLQILKQKVLGDGEVKGDITKSSEQEIITTLIGSLEQICTLLLKEMGVDPGSKRSIMMQLRYPFQHCLYGLASNLTLVRLSLTGAKTYHNALAQARTHLIETLNVKYCNKRQDLHQGNQIHYLPGFMEVCREFNPAGLNEIAKVPDIFLQKVNAEDQKAFRQKFIKHYTPEFIIATVLERCLVDNFSAANQSDGECWVVNLEQSGSSYGEFKEKLEKLWQSFAGHHENLEKTIKTDDYITIDISEFAQLLRIKIIKKLCQENILVWPKIHELASSKELLLEDFAEHYEDVLWSLNADGDFPIISAMKSGCWQNALFLLQHRHMQERAELSWAFEQVLDKIVKTLLQLTSSNIKHASDFVVYLLPLIPKRSEEIQALFYLALRTNSAALIALFLPYVDINAYSSDSQDLVITMVLRDPMISAGTLAWLLKNVKALEVNKPELASKKTPLMVAAEVGDFAKFKVLLDHSDVNLLACIAIDEEHPLETVTAKEIAQSNHHEAIVDHLVKFCLPRKLENNYLSFIVSKISEEDARYYLSTLRAKLDDEAFKRECTIFWHRCASHIYHNNKFSLFSYLLPYIQDSINQTRIDGVPLLYKAVSDRNSVWLEHLLPLNLDVNINFENKTLIALLAEKQMMSLVVDFSSRVTTPECLADAVLYCAMINEWSKVAGLLNRCDEVKLSFIEKAGSMQDYTAMHFALLANNIEMIALIASKVKVMPRCLAHFVTDHKEVNLTTFNYVLTLPQVDRDEVDYEGCTALIRAYRAGNEARVEALLKLAVRVDIRDSNGMSVIHFATKKGEERMELHLRAIQQKYFEAHRSRLVHASCGRWQEALAGITPDEVNLLMEDSTLLHFAAQANRVDLMGQLLALGADVNLTCNGGAPVLHVALMSHHISVDVLRCALRAAKVNVNVVFDNKIPFEKAVEINNPGKALALAESGSSLAKDQACAEVVVTKIFQDEKFSKVARCVLVKQSDVLNNSAVFKEKLALEYLQRCNWLVLINEVLLELPPSSFFALLILRQAWAKGEVDVLRQHAAKFVPAILQNLDFFIKEVWEVGITKSNEDLKFFIDLAVVLNDSAAQKKLVNQCAANKTTALIEAVKANDLSGVKTLLRLGAKIDYAAPVEEGEAETVLQYALTKVGKINWDICDALIRCPGDLTNKGRALLVAVHHQKWQFVTYLLDHEQVDLNWRYTSGDSVGFYALHFLAKYNQRELIQKLLTKSAKEINNRLDDDSLTVLQYASGAAEVDLETFNLLLNYFPLPGDINLAVKNETALMIAIRCNSPQKALALFNKGASIAKPPANTETILTDIFLQDNFFDLVKAILRQRPDLMNRAVVQTKLEELLASNQWQALIKWGTLAEVTSAFTLKILEQAALKNQTQVVVAFQELINKAAKASPAEVGSLLVRLIKKFSSLSVETINAIVKAFAPVLNLLVADKTPLMVAIEENAVSFIESFLRERVDLKVKNKDNRMAIYCAATCSRWQLVTTLFTLGGYDQRNIGEILLLAARGKQWALIEQILSLPVEFDLTWHFTSGDTEKGCYALHFLIQHNQVELMINALAKKPEAVNYFMESCCTLLQYASANSHVTLATFNALMEYFPVPGKLDETLNNKTALMMAVESGDAEKALALFKKGASINKPPANTDTILIDIFLKDNFFELSREILRQRPQLMQGEIIKQKLDQLLQKEQWEALIKWGTLAEVDAARMLKIIEKAALKNQENVVAAFQDFACKAASGSDVGFSALLIRLIKNSQSLSVQTINAVIKALKPVINNVVDGQAPLMVAATLGSMVWVEGLLGEGADGKQQNAKKDMAIYCAAQNQKWSLVEIFLRREDYDVHNLGGALLFAVRYEQWALAENILVRPGALSASWSFNDKTVDMPGFYALHFLVKHNQRALLAYALTRENADKKINSRNGDCQALLHLASANSSVDFETFEILVAVPGIDLNAKTKNRTALQLSLVTGQQDKFDRLLRAGADLKQCDWSQLIKEEIGKGNWQAVLNVWRYISLADKEMSLRELSIALSHATTEAAQQSCYDLVEKFLKYENDDSVGQLIFRVFQSPYVSLSIFRCVLDSTVVSRFISSAENLKQFVSHAALVDVLQLQKLLMILIASNDYSTVDTVMKDLRVNLYSWREKRDQIFFVAHFFLSIRKGSLAGNADSCSLVRSLSGLRVFDAEFVSPVLKSLSGLNEASHYAFEQLVIWSKTRLSPLQQLDSVDDTTIMRMLAKLARFYELIKGSDLADEEKQKWLLHISDESFQCLKGWQSRTSFNRVSVDTTLAYATGLKLFTDSFSKGFWSKSNKVAEIKALMSSDVAPKIQRAFAAPALTPN